MAATATRVGPPAAGETPPGRVVKALQSFPLLLALALAAQLVILSAVVNTAYWEDDNPNAYTRGYIRWIGEHFWHFIWSANVTQVTTLGRPMPLGVLQTYGTFYVLHDRVAYKAALILLTLIASAMLALVVRRLGASPAVAALSAALPALAWQLHLQHDPLISYVGLVQTVTIYAAAMILVFQSWLRRGGRWRIAVVMLLIAAANFTYQDAYLLPLMLIPVAWHERRCSWRKAVVLAAPGLIVCGAFILLALILEQNLPASSAGYAANYNPTAVLTAWAKILTSGLPLIGWVATPGPHDLPASQLSHSILRGIVVAVLLFPILWATARPAATVWLRDRRTVVTIIAVTAVMMLTPSALTSVAPQYQQQLVWGWGYLPMFFAVIGWTMLAALLIAAIFRRLPGRPAVAVTVSAVLAIAGGIAASLDAAASARVVAYMEPVTNSRDLIEASFSRGVLSRVPTNSTVLWYGPEMVLPTSIWVGGAVNVEAWTREFVNRPLTMHLISPQLPSALVCSDANGSPAPCTLLHNPVFWLRTTSSGPDGFVAVAPLGAQHWTPATNAMAEASTAGSRPVVYVQDPHISAAGGALPFTVTLLRPQPGASPRSVAVAADQLQVLRRGSGWALVQLSPQPPLVASSIGVVFR